MNFSNIKITAWFNNYANWLPILQWSGWIVSTFILAKMFWVWTEHFNAPTVFKPLKVVPAKVSRSAQNIDISKLTRLNLMGSLSVEQPTAVVEETAPITNLNLKLKGIYSSDDSSKSNAIIEDGRGKQFVYFIDDPLKVSGRVFLRQVYVDKVILETNGRKETLRLEVEKQANDILRNNASRKNKNSRRSKAKGRVQDKRNNRKISRQLSRYRDKLVSDPTSVSDVISGRPHFIDGELKGFRISPGRDRKLFQELGLRRGDLVKSINGVPLNNMQDAMTLMNDAQSIQDLNIEIVRDGGPVSLLLNLNDKK